MWLYNYKAITSEVDMKDNATDGVQLRYFTRCLQPLGSPLNETRKCDGLGVGTIIDFTVSINVIMSNN